VKTAKKKLLLKVMGEVEKMQCKQKKNEKLLLNLNLKLKKKYQKNFFMENCCSMEWRSVGCTHNGRHLDKNTHRKKRYKKLFHSMLRR
jgi:hypothetical protein